MYRKYYKYNTWTQPSALTTNGTMGGDAFACNQSAYYTESDGSKQEAWRAFKTDFSVNNGEWQVNNVNLNTWYYIEWYNPTPLTITNLKIYNGQSPYVVKDYILYGSNDYNNWIEITSGTNTKTSTGSWDIVIPSNQQTYFKYWKLNCKPTNTTSMMISRIIISAYTGISESTSSDYDFYKDFYNYKAKKESVIHYYRYIGSEEPWTQPSISANGTLGGDSFAVAASSEYTSTTGSTQFKAYKAFNSTGWASTSSDITNAYFIFYNPVPIKVTSLTFGNTSTILLSGEYFESFALYGSKDNSNWDLIGNYTQGSGTHTHTIENTEFYNYYKIQNTGAGGHGGFGSGVGIGNLIITATQGSSVTEESLSPFANINLVGEPILTGYEISGFLANDYATLPNVFNPEGNDFEVGIKFTTPDDFTISSNNRFLFFTNTSGTSRGISIHCQANTNSLACAFTNSDNTGWDNSLGGNFITNNLQPSTIYWVKLKRENGTLYKYYSLNGIEYILNESSPISMTVPTMVNTYLGTRYDDSTSTAYEYWYDASIDLSECYIKLNNVYFWKGVDYDFSKKEYKYKIIKAIEESSSSTGYSTYTFEPYPSLRKWVIPEGITKVHVDCVATRGKSGKYTGGYGGRVQTDLSVTPGQTLYVYVGKNQGSPDDTKIAYYNAADIRTDNTGILDTTSLQSRIIVAGAGGNGANTGSSKDGNETIGAGGGLEGGTGGSTGYSVGGAGGTQSSGGGFGIGSNGGSSEKPGAGGAGWYGGKGGGYHGHNSVHYNGGGGGGSSYTDSILCENVVHTQGYNSGEGYITISAINGTDIIYYSEDTFVYKTPKF